MKFLDEAKIYVKSGDGGAGCCSFRREKNVPMGGPDGGNGGHGGDVILECVDGLNTLIDFRYTQHFKARKGEHGKGSNRTGESSEAMIIKVPVGTEVLEEDKETLIIDMVTPGQTYLLAKGGKGGAGNACFKSSINQAPRMFTEGEPGQELWVWLKLKLIADAGLLGLPNAGKSTFLAATSRAKPKIADYPFTTLKPQLGMVAVGEREFVLADIPGLIEGAHEGVGLGLKFLSHVERCSVLLHLVDGTAEDVAANYKTIRNELRQYSEELAEKPEIIALNKSDAIPEDELEAKKKALKKASGQKVHVISGATGNGVKEILKIMLRTIDEAKENAD